MNAFSESALLNELGRGLVTFSDDCAKGQAIDYLYGHLHGYIDALFVAGVIEIREFEFWREVTAAWQDYDRTEKLLNQDVPNFLKKQAE